MNEEYLEIHSEVFDTDYDEVGFEPEINNGDADEEAAEIYGYNK